MSLKRISGLWLREGKGGKYLSGNVREPIPAGSKLLIFPNSRKQSDANPDYVMHLATDGGARPGVDADSDSEPLPSGDSPEPVLPSGSDSMPF